MVLSLASTSPVDPIIASREGGTRFTVRGDPAAFNLERTYRVHVGLNADATDPVCYAGQGLGTSIVPTDTETLECFLPELDSLVADVLDVYVEEIETSDSGVVADALTIIDPTLSTSQFSMRRLFAPNRRVGRRNLTVFGTASPPLNLFTQSQDMTDAAWTVQALSVISGEEDPFGGTSGFILHEDNTGPTQHNIAQDIGALGISAIAEQVYTLSLYVKAINRSWFSLGGQMGTKVYAWVFDIANGVVGTTVFDNDPMIITPRIRPVDLSVGWFRLELTIRPSESGVFTVNLVIREGDNFNTFTGLDQDSVRIAFPAMDLFPLSRAYRPTAAVPIS